MGYRTGRLKHPPEAMLPPGRSTTDDELEAVADKAIADWLKDRLSDKAVIDAVVANLEAKASDDEDDAMGRERAEYG